jgi:succinyl-diaminopimelate desuccinylase
MSAAIPHAPRADLDFLVDVLASLVRIPSINPGGNEAAVCERIAKWVADETVAEIHTVETFPGRPSLAVVLAGRGDGPTLVLNGHTDTVPIENEQLWSFDPFGATIADGKLYGRGACDMKGGLAVALGVVRAFSGRRDQLSGTLIAHFACGEERAEPGTLSLIEAGYGGDMAIVLEPTDLEVATCARGIAFYEIEVTGRSAHGSRSAEGLNPIGALPGVLEALRRHEQQAATHSHPLLPPAAASPTMLRSGVKENMLPDTATLTIDRRLLPGEDTEAVRMALLESVRDCVAESYGIAVRGLPQGFAPAAADADSEIATQVRAAMGSVLGRQARPWGTPYSSDFRNFVNDAGIPAVTFGPGRIEHAHSIDEHIDLAQLREGAEVVAAVANMLLSSTPERQRT